MVDDAAAGAATSIVGAPPLGTGGGKEEEGGGRRERGTEDAEYVEPEEGEDEGSNNVAADGDVTTAGADDPASLLLAGLTLVISMSRVEFDIHAMARR